MSSFSSSNEDIEHITSSPGKFKTCFSETDLRRKIKSHAQSSSSSRSSISNSLYDLNTDRNRQSYYSVDSSTRTDLIHKQSRKSHNTKSVGSHDRHTRVHSWSGFNEALYQQRINRNSAYSITSNHSAYHNEHAKPYHGKRYVKIKSKIKTNRRFERIVLAQTLAFDCTASEVFAEAGISMTTKNLESEDSKQPIGAIWAVRFSKDGKYMATAGQNCIINVWKVLRDTTLSDNIQVNDILPHEQSIKVFHDAPVRIYTGHKADVLDLSWSKNNFLLSSSLDKTVRLWHISQATCLCAFSHTDIVTSVRFHPKDDRFFLSGCLDSRVRLWSIPEKRVAFWNEIANGSMITAAGFNFDGRIVCVGTDRGDLLFYETQGLKYNTQILVKKSRQKHGKKVTGIEPMPGIPVGEERILVTTNDSRVWMINMKDKSCIYAYKGLRNHSKQIRASFSNDGRYIICGSEDGCVYMWCTDQVSYSPFQHWKESHLQAAASLCNLGDQFIHTMMQYELASGEQSSKKISSWLRKGEREVTDRLRSRNEHFNAHIHAVTAAVFAPLKTRQMLAKSGGDVIFDHTPIPTQRKSGPYHESNCQEAVEQFDYPESHIIVSTDIHGAIKVWRMDSGHYENHDLSPSSAKEPEPEGEKDEQKGSKSARKRLFSKIMSKLI